MSPRTKSPATKDRIIKTAYSLFYDQGYQATGINQIIQEAKVTKPTFYNYFNSKEDLCVTYLQKRHQDEVDFVMMKVRSAANPYERFMAVLDATQDRLTSTRYKGCAFFNLITEVKDQQNPILKQARFYTDTVRNLLKELSNELVKSDPKYKHLDPDHLADAYYVILGGMIMASQEYQQDWPYEAAKKQLKQLVGK